MTTAPSEHVKFLTKEYIHTNTLPQKTAETEETQENIDIYQTVDYI